MHCAACGNYAEFALWRKRIVAFDIALLNPPMPGRASAMLAAGIERMSLVSALTYLLGYDNQTALYHFSYD